MKKDSPTSTILVISTGFLILYFIFSWQWAIIFSLVIGLIGIVSPFLSNKIEWLWLKLSTVLGYVVPNILLSVVFYLFLFPISILFKLFNKDQLRLSNKYDSYFISVNKKMDKESFEKIW